MKILLLFCLLIGLLWIGRATEAAQEPECSADQLESAIRLKLESEWTAALEAHREPNTNTVNLQEVVPMLRFLVAEAEELMRNFEAKYPQDQRSWALRLLEMKRRDHLRIGEDQLAGKDYEPMSAKLREEILEIARSPEAPLEVRQQAYTMLLEAASMDFAKNPQTVPQLITLVDEAIRELHGTDQAASLVVGRAEVLAGGNQPKFEEELRKIAAGSDAKAAEFARARLGAKSAVEKLAEKKTPLDLQFTAVDGREVDIARMRGSVVLIDFWATWCGPCVAELPEIKALEEKYRSRGFQVIGISLDRDRDALLAFIKAKNLPWPHHFDGNGWDNAVATRYGIRRIPQKWLVDRDGFVVDLDAKSGLEGKVEALLQKPE